MQNQEKTKENQIRSLLLTVFSIISISTVGAKENEKQVQQWMQNQQVLFLENKGQITDMNGMPVPFVLLKVEAPGLDMYVTEKGLTYVFVNSKSKGERIEKNDEFVKTTWSRVEMGLKGAKIKKENIRKKKPLVTDYNYFNDNCPQGIYGVKRYSEITIEEIYPGIDWVLYNSSSVGFKYDFIIHPEADPEQIELVYSSLNSIRVDNDGNMGIETNHGILKEAAPLSIQDNEVIESRFVKTMEFRNENGGYDTHIKFDIANYNKTDFLRIDPALVWATLYGGSDNDATSSITCDLSGNIFVVGNTNSGNFPTLNSGTFYQGTQSIAFNQDIFILKFSNSGVLLWATYYGSGGGSSVAWSTATDKTGNVFVVGATGSPTFPLQNSGTFFQAARAGSTDGFILKFSNSGVRLWATYYGGSGLEDAHSVAVDPLDNVFIVGYTGSSDFPILNAGTFFQPVNSGGTWDAFILKFNNAGTRLWATYYGGNGSDIAHALAIDATGNAFVVGETTSTNFPLLNSGTFFQGAFVASGDAFILKFSNLGVRLWATYYSGSGDDRGCSAAVDATGNLFVTGWTSSTNLPVQNSGTFFQGTNAGAYDAFILKFNNVGTRLWASYYGGSGSETLFYFDAIAIDNCNNVYIGFITPSANIATKIPCDAGGYFSGSFGGGSSDHFIVKFNNSGVLLWASYFGGDGQEFRPSLAIDLRNNLFVSGVAINIVNNNSYSLTNPGAGAYYDGVFNGGQDAIIAKFVPPTLNLTTAVISPGCTCNGSTSVNISGGCSPYKYSWYNNGWTQIGNTQTIGSLCNGNYQVIVNDTVNCAKDTAFVNVPPGGGSLNLTSTQTNALCFGDDNGAATITSNSGTGPYSYTWSNGQTTPTATGLSAGNYTITVTDAGGCISSSTVTLISPSPLAGQFNKGTATCKGCGCKEWILVNAIGGTIPYSYSWPDGYDKRYKNGLCPGTYTINIRDKSGCSININLSTP